MLLFTIIFFTLFVTMPLYVIIKKRSTYPRDQRVQFENCCKNLNLDKKQQLLMRKLAAHHPFDAAPNELFTSTAYFERCMDSAVKLLLLTNVDESTIQAAETELNALRTKAGFHRIPHTQPIFSSRAIDENQIIDIYHQEDSSMVCKDAMVIKQHETFFRLQCKADTVLTSGLTSGDPLRLVFSRSNDAVYEIDTEVYRIDSDSCIDCLHSLKLRRTQLREFIRMEVKTPVNITLLGQQKVHAQKNRSVNMCELADVSGGGLSFISTDAFRQGDNLSISFSLGNENLQGLTGKLLRISELDECATVKFRNHVQFYRIEDAQRDKIVRFIFDRQRKSISAA